MLLADCNEIVEKVGFTQPTISHHLAILGDVGLVNIREEGKQAFYSLNQEYIAFCCGQLIIKFAPESVTKEKFVRELLRNKHQPQLGGIGKVLNVEYAG